MPNTMLQVQRPFSLQHYAKLHNLDPRWVLLNAPNLFSSFYYHRDEFDGTLDAVYWSTDVTAGGAPTAFAYNAQRNGGARGATGATDNGVTAIYAPNVQWDPADNPTWFLRWRAPAAVDGFAFEILWSDAKTDEKLVCFSATSAAGVPTVTNGITDFGGLSMNTDHTLTTTAIVGDGTTGSVAGGLVSTWTPTASGIIDMIIGVGANKTSVQIWDSNTFIGEFSVANGPDSAVLVRPSAIFKVLDTTTKSIDLLKSVILAEENAT